MTAIEYGLLAALIAVVIVSSLTAFGPEMNAEFATVSNTIALATTSR